jgi:hypothetical protein
MDGPVPSKEVYRRAEQDGVRPITLWRAKQELCVESHKTSMRGPWLWEGTTELYRYILDDEYHPRRRMFKGLG